jgi:hypothetical protein
VCRQNSVEAVQAIDWNGDFELGVRMLPSSRILVTSVSYDTVSSNGQIVMELHEYHVTETSVHLYFVILFDR